MAEAGKNRFLCITFLILASAGKNPIHSSEVFLKDIKKVKLSCLFRDMKKARSQKKNQELGFSMFNT